MSQLELMSLARLLKDAAEEYDEGVYAKMRLHIVAGNNLVFEWDDVGDDDVAFLGRGVDAVGGGR